MGSALPFSIVPVVPVPAIALDASGLLDVLREAIRRAYNQVAFSVDCGVSEGQVTRWVKGVDRFPLTHLEKAPAVQREFAKLFAERVGFDVRAIDARAQRRREIEQLQQRLSMLLAEEMREAA